MKTTSRIPVLFSACLAACSADTFVPDDGGDGGDPGDSAKDAHVVGPDGDVDGGADGDGGEAKDGASEAETGPTFKRVFVSSTKTASNFGGLSQGDAICGNDATDAGLGGTWKAWLSTTTVSAGSRLAHASVPYQLVDGTLVASNWSALVSGAPLKNAIDLDEHGNYVPFNDSSEIGYTWTGTTTDGGLSAGATCSDWTVSEVCTTVNYYGTVGTDGNTDYRWTTRGATGCCTSQIFALFCFEQ